MTPGNLFQKHRGILVISALFFLTGILRLNDLSLLNPDSSRYLIVGNAISKGEGFVDNTQPDPDRYFVHAPLYPVLISPVEYFFPLSLTAVKIWTLLWGCAAVFLFYFWMCKMFSQTAAVVSSIILVCNPLLLIYSTEVLSEAPFLVFLMLVLIFGERVIRSERVGRSDAAWLVISTVALALLREAGVGVVLAVAIVLFSRKHWITGIITLLSGAGLLVLWYFRNHYWIGPVAPSQSGNISLLFQHFVTPPGSPIINEFSLRIWIKFKEYIIHIAGMFVYPLFTTLQFKLNFFPTTLHQLLQGAMDTGKYFVAVIISPLILYGIYADFRNSRSALLRILIFFSYLGVIFIYPVYDIRFLLPLLPLLIFYSVITMRIFLRRAKTSDIFVHGSYLYMTAVILMIPNLSNIYEVLKLNLAYRESPRAFYDKVRHQPEYPLMFTLPWGEMGRWIQENLSDSIVLASPAKDLAVVVGRRKVAEIDQGVTLPVFETLLRDNGVEYLLTPNRRENFRVFEFAMRESKRYWFEPVYSVANLNLVKVHSRLREGLQEDKMFSAIPDSLNEATKFLFRGRKALMDENYTEAIENFRKAYLLDSTHLEILYQTILSYSLMGDSVNTKIYYGKLFLQPQALGYAIPARLQMQAMSFLSRAKANTYQASIAVESYKTADLYWKLGYPRLAARIMNEMLEKDSTYFMGLLWGIHYNLQNNDTAIAKKYLGILSNIDKENPIVTAFSRIMLAGDSLNMNLTDKEKSSLHYKIGDIYRQIELNEIAIDEAERALRYNPHNWEAQTLIADVFEKKGNLRMAETYYQESLGNNPGNHFSKARLDSVRMLRFH